MNSLPSFLYYSDYLPHFARHLSTATKSGVARNIDEYVPAMIPTRSVSEKSRVEAGPRRKSAVKAIAVVSDVFTERTRVWFKLRPATSVKSSLRPRS